jgi:hypothetical protein
MVDIFISKKLNKKEGIEMMIEIIFNFGSVLGIILLLMKRLTAEELRKLMPVF